jgi:hypothetical protein
MLLGTVGKPCPGPAPSFCIRSWTGNEPISRNPSGVPIFDGLAAHGTLKAADLALRYHVLAAVIDRAAFARSITRRF